MRETIHALIDTEEDTTVEDKLAEIVAIYDILGNKFGRYENKLRTFQWSAKEKVNNIKRGETGVRVEIAAIRDKRVQERFNSERSAVEALTRPGIE